MPMMSKIFENGEFVQTAPFANPVMMTFKGIDKPVRMVDHAHEEPITLGINADSCLKGARKILFRYGGPMLNFRRRCITWDFCRQKKKSTTG